MELIKKNLISVICGVVALAAIGVAFFMLPTRQAGLQSKLDAREQTYKSLHTLLTKTRQLPSVNPDSTEQAQLTVFPSEKVITAGEALMKEVKKESDAIVKAAEEMNRHTLLTPGCLPSPSIPAAINFRTAYRDALPLPNPTNPSNVLGSRFAKELNAGMPPTQADIAAKQQAMAEDMKKKMLFLNAQGQAANQAQVDAAIAQKAADLPKEEMQKVADTCKVYVSPDTFEMYPPIAAAAGAPQPTDIYYAQLSYWIQHDVVEAVNYTNRDSKKIADSPVKHLVAIRCGVQGAPTFIATAVGQGNSDPDAEIKPNKMVSPTGRYCNGLYDVFHFTVTAEVEAAKVGDFLRALGYKRFITPLSADVKAIDNAIALAQGHAYGEKAMLNLTVPCEVLYLRKWNAQYIPPAIKTLLGIPLDGQQPATAAPAAGTTPP